VKREDGHDRRLPAQRAFVVQLAATAEVASGHLEGRVEHVVSGQATHFASLADLLAFMAHVLRQQRPAGATRPALQGTDDREEAHRSSFRINNLRST
jgi:hypothetical protein